MSILNVSSAWGVGSSSSTYKQKQQQQNQQQQQQQNIVRDWASKILMNSQRQRQRQRFRTTTTTTVRPSSDCAKTIQYEQRKAEWANRYTNLDSLRDTFGSNINKVWGDLDAATARRLYKTLLPKALLELVKVGVQPEDLAPLAYQARVAAKLYARERCQVPARTAASLYDGFRQWKRYGKFQTTGMSYDQVWDKYHKVIMDEEEDNDGVDSYLTEEDVTAKICLKILERSCVSNEHVDRWVLPPEDQGEREDLQIIAQTLESDVRKLLDPMIACQTNNTQNGSTSAAQSQQNKKKIRLLQQYRILRLIARARRRARGRQQLALSR
jgi:hypothetical protein